MTCIIGKRRARLFAVLSLALLAVFALPNSPFSVKSVEAEPSEQTLVLKANNVTYTKGYSSSGSYVDTHLSDNVYHQSLGWMHRVYDPEYGRVTLYTLGVVYYFKAPKPVLNTVEIEVNAEARTDIATTNWEQVELYIFKYATGGWENIGSFYGTTIDAWITWVKTTNLLDYVDSQGNMKLMWAFNTMDDDFTELWVDFQSITLTLAPYEWTFMVYLDADWVRWYRDEWWKWQTWVGDDAATPEVNKMEMVGSSSEVAVIVQADWFLAPGVDRYFITQDSNPNAITSPKVEHLNELNTGDPATLTNFINWTVSNFPAQRYATVFYDHGHGFIGFCEDADGDTGDPYNPPPTDALSMSELKSALQNAQAATEETIDLFGFIACLMQMTEVAYQIRDYGKVLVASEEVMRADIGWPFHYILDDLTETPTMDEVQLSQVIVNDYRDIVLEVGPGSIPETISSIDLTRMQILGARVNDLALTLTAKLGTIRESIEDARLQAYDFFDSRFIDLYNFTEAISNINDPEVQNPANALLLEINQTVLYEWHADGADAHGVSIFFPFNSNGYQLDRATYEAVDLSTQYNWDDFLRAYLGIQ